MPKNISQFQELKRIAAEVMNERGLTPVFSAAALKQADAIQQASAEMGSTIRDLRSLLWSSIDNDDSRDLDQIEFAETLDDGSIKVLVSIADVDCLVKTGTPIDDHARMNTTSVYTVAQIFPMLPEKLSTNLTSFSEDQERLSMVMEMTVTPDGIVRQSDIYRARVVNRAKLAYRSVAAWLDGTGPVPARIASVAGLDAQIRLQDKVAQTLKEQRHRNGALNLESLEARAVFDGELLVDLQPNPKNRAQELIEDLMIAANGVAARFLESKGLPSLRRILRTPKRWDGIATLAKGFGDTLPPTPDASALDAFLSRRRLSDPQRFADLSLSVIKLLGSGEYVFERPGQTSEGHFGLAARDYTHSTAPNRRFPDVITQRLLKAALLNQPAPYSNVELQSLAEHCTEQEDNAAKVERQVKKSAAAMLLGSRVGQDFDAIVTGASDKGTWVRITGPMAEGRLVKDFQGLDIGNRIKVKLLHTDMERGFIDFARVN